MGHFLLLLGVRHGSPTPDESLQPTWNKCCRTKEALLFAASPPPQHLNDSITIDKKIWWFK